MSSNEKLIKAAIIAADVHSPLAMKFKAAAQNEHKPANLPMARRQ